MLENDFRPWGLLPWVFKKLPEKKWRLIGCLAPEQRCLGALTSLIEKSLIDDYLLLEIIDPHDPVITKKQDNLKGKIRSELKKIDRNSKQHIFPCELLESPFENILNKIDSFVSNSSENIVLDIHPCPRDTSSQS